MAEDKKILENKKLDMEDLDKVAGGTEREMEMDIKHFKELGVLPGDIHEHDKGAILRAFEAFGIEAEPHGGMVSSNRYKYRGNTISRKEAWLDVQDQYYLGNYHPRVR